MMTRKLIAVIAAVAAASPVSAGNLMLGPAKISATYGFETRYEDNIYRVPRDISNHAVAGGGVRGSWIFANNIGVKATAPLGQHKVSAGYDLTAENYTKQSKANDAINQRLGADWGYQGSMIDAKAMWSYINTQDPAFNPNGTVLNGDLVSRERRWQNGIGASAEYQLGEKFFAGGDFDWTIQRYLNRSGGTSSLANTLNRSEGTFGVKAGYKVMPKTRVYFAEHRRMVHYTEETRQDNHRDWLTDFGIEGEFTGKLKGKAQIGHEYRGYDRDSANPGRDTVGRVIRLMTQLDYQAMENCQWVLTVNRATNESSTGQSRYFTSTGFNAAVNHKFGAKIAAGANFGYQQDRYSQDFTQGSFTHSRRDDNYQFGMRGDYKFNDMVSAGGSFTNNSRFSTFSRQYNYRDNITAANVRLNF